MANIALILIAALTFSILVTPIARRTALRSGLIAIPRSRDSHTTPIPLLGGAAIYTAFVAALLLFGDLAHIRELIGILLGATIVSLFGLADDRWGMPAIIKLGGQMLAATVLLLAGTQVQLLPWPALNWALTLLWVVVITNAINFLDNMDGLSGGVATIAAAFFLLLAAMNQPRQVLVGAMAAALIGACIGFLRYNFNPASIFMGDTGSLFIGFILAALAIKLRFLNNIPLVTWLVPVCVLGLPLFDLALVFVARVRRGVNPFTTAGKDHLSHRLHALGMTKREAVLTCYLLAGASGLIGVYITQARPSEAYLVFAGLLIVALAGIVWLERVCPSGQPRQHQTD
ncbi:MraY family glycosyltransferase [Chloroflexus sp. MS-CIW-1]|jgi:UDP-GlcNAc:undecaprenyl-phosphate GlcNAc-1-phosphate transferase|uniref:MraY family glycosyltransferase n=1 Tax=Chloroflexus sp. MS-CIW-1 TaxID=3055768 RepID=UPI00264A1D98|nr:MraY family glycosyltransferase [Chloroflexus sp. MS-CIW-1]MDN5273203.1 MraY family glycosyltransferase [Chloroflexus sp. MS-CIW-1]